MFPCLWKSYKKQERKSYRSEAYLECMIYIVGPNDTSLSFWDDWLSNTVVQPHLRGGHVFESNHVFISPTLLNPCVSSKKRLLMREGVGVYDIHCGPKSYKFRLLEKLVV